MRKIVLALAAVAAVGLAIPTFAASPAEARDVIVIKHKKHKMHRDNGRHLGWYKHRHHRQHFGHRYHRNHYGHHYYHGPRVVIR